MPPEDQKKPHSVPEEEETKKTSDRPIKEIAANIEKASESERGNVFFTELSTLLDAKSLLDENRLADENKLADIKTLIKEWLNPDKLNLPISKIKNRLIDLIYDANGEPVVTKLLTENLQIILINSPRARSSTAAALRILSPCLTDLEASEVTPVLDKEQFGQLPLTVLSLEPSPIELSAHSDSDERAENSIKPG